MCGITGILSLDPSRRVERDALRRMRRELRHRGPDDEGEYLDPAGRCGLSFARLSIIDLATGNQPVFNEDRSAACVFNGEIYNYRALRSELAAAGHQFATQGDAEVLVHAYEAFGPDFVQRLSGMFAIAIWDAARGVLTLARDRLGKKPLVYAWHDGRLYFASEAKAILAQPDLPRRLDPQALHEYLLFQYVPAPHSIFRGFAKLPPGMLLAVGPVSDRSVPRAPVSNRKLSPNPSPLGGEVGRGVKTAAEFDPPPTAPCQGGGIGENLRCLPLPAGPASTGSVPLPSNAQIKAYWTLPLEPTKFSGTYEDAKQELGRRLTRAVEMRLIADVPLGAFLSGGVDSSIVVGLMRRLGVHPLRTFSIGFADPRYDESGPARRVAELFQTEHHERLVTPRAREVLETLAYHYDEPFADSSAIPTLYLSRFARQSVTVALTGDAGDECFAGYDRYRAARLAARLDAVPRPLRAAAARLADWLPHNRAKSTWNRAHRFLSAAALPPARRYRTWVQVFAPSQLAAGYQPEFAEQVDFDAPLVWFDELYGQGARLDLVERAIATDFRSYLPFDLLVKVDVASMAASLECRSPFLDHELIEFAQSLPIHWRLGPRGGKRILKDWAAELLPRELLNRPKMGFGVPVGEWFRSELAETLREHVLAPQALCARVFRRAWLTRLVEDHIRRAANHEHALWALLMLELWQKRWHVVQ